MFSLPLTHHWPEVSRLNLSACIWTETVPFFWSENTRMVSSTYMTEKKPVPEIGKGILRPHAVIWPPLMFAFTNLGKLVLLSWIHRNERFGVFTYVCVRDIWLDGLQQAAGDCTLCVITPSYAITPSSLWDRWNVVKINTQSMQYERCCNHI